MAPIKIDYDDDRWTSFYGRRFPTLHNLCHGYVLTSQGVEGGVGVKTTARQQAKEETEAAVTPDRGRNVWRQGGREHNGRKGVGVVIRQKLGEAQRYKMQRRQWMCCGSLETPYYAG